jgi:hypothetical protein
MESIVEQRGLVQAILRRNPDRRIFPSSVGDHACKGVEPWAQFDGRETVLKPLPKNGPRLLLRGKSASRDSEAEITQTLAFRAVKRNHSPPCYSWVKADGCSYIIKRLVTGPPEPLSGRNTVTLADLAG